MKATEQVAAAQQPLSVWTLEPDCLNSNPYPAVYELHGLGRSLDLSMPVFSSVPWRVMIALTSWGYYED